MQQLTFITGNKAKAEQLSIHLQYPVTHQKLDLSEIQSLDLSEVVEQKAKTAYELIKQPVLVEDTALTFLALGKLPGPLIKWFLQELDNEGLCHLLNGYDNRGALAQVEFGYFDGANLHRFTGEMEGTIADKPRGNEGFGWDPVFIPKGYQKTWGEMTLDEQKKTSMRRIALLKFQAFLTNH